MERLLSDVNDVIMASWRSGVKAAYNRTVQRWLEYYRRWGFHPQHPTASEVLDFLHALFMQVLGYSAINSYSSALNSILQVSGIERIGEHILVPWLMKSVFNLRSPQPRYSKMCDVIRC